MSTYSPSRSSAVFECDPSSGVVLREENEVEFFDVESNFANIVDNGLKIINSTVPSNKTVNCDGDNAEELFKKFSELGRKLCDEPSEVFDSLDGIEGFVRGPAGTDSRLLFDAEPEVSDFARDFTRDFRKSFDFFDDLRGIDDAPAPVEVFSEISDFIIFGFDVVSQFLRPSK